MHRGQCRIDVCIRYASSFMQRRHPPMQEWIAHAARKRENAMKRVVQSESRDATVTGDEHYSFHPQSGPSGEHINVQYTQEELTPGPAMLNRIVNDLKSKGYTFILPVSDDSAMDELAEPMRRLMKQGVRGEFVIDAFVKRPELLRVCTKQFTATWAVLELLVERCALTYEDAMRLFARHITELLAVSIDSIHSRLDAFVRCEVGDGNVRRFGRLITARPELLFTGDGEEMVKVAEGLKSFFTRSQLRDIVTLIPHILLGNFEQLEEKYEYIYYHMCCEGDAFRRCVAWVDLPLTEIIHRHRFLLRTGKYITPVAKRPQLAKENPPLERIFDTTDAEFASRVAGVTLEEWMVFRELMDQEEREKDLDRPYERIKPSMRKALERRKKMASEGDDGEDRDRIFEDAGDRSR